jgi:hypothetical protein
MYCYAASILNQSEVEWPFAVYHKQQLKGMNIVEIVIPEKSNIYVYLGLVLVFFTSQRRALLPDSSNCLHVANVF